MRTEGLVETKGIVTGSAAVNLTAAGRAEAITTLLALPHDKYPQSPPGAPEIGTLAVTGTPPRITVHSYAGWRVEWPLTQELRGEKT